MLPSNFTQKELDAFYLHFQPDVVSATGGEPLLQPVMVEKLARSVSRYGGALELVTNGFFITENTVARLNNINPKTFYQISLDGDKPYHDYLRNHPQAFEMAIQAIKIASASGAVTKARFTATNGNLSTLPTVIRILDDLGDPSIKLVIRPILSKGRGLDNELTVDKDFEYFDQFADMAEMIEVETTDNTGKCGCGVDTVAIDPLGDIYPCTYFTRNPEYKMGHLKDFSDMTEHKDFKKFNGACYARSL